MSRRAKNKCAVALEAATSWRIKNGMENTKGYVLTYGKKVLGFAYDLPKIGGRNPICVDEDMDCYFPRDRNNWMCFTTPDKCPPPVSNSEHISSVAEDMLCYIYPSRADAIKKWFASCTVPKSAGSWARLERANLRTIYRYISCGITADSLLM